MSHALTAAAIAFGVAVIAPTLVIPVLRRLRAVDVPSGRSLHDRPAIRGVGLAPLLGFLAACGFLLAVEGHPVIVVAAAAGSAASVLGLLEDARGVSVGRRAAGQVLIALAATAALIAGTGASWLLVPLGVIGIAAYINVANFMDGVDGISGLHGIVAGATLAIAGAGTDRGWLLQAGLVIAASFAAFLPWNLLRRGTFLGDAGSYLLGATVSVLSAAAFFDGVPLAVVLGPVLIYLLDTSSTLVRRQARGDQLATSHRDHVYQRLALRKMGHVPAALLVTGFSAAAAAIGLIALQGSGPANLVAFAGFALLGVAYLLLPRWILGSGPDVTDPPVQVRPQDPARRFSSRRWVVAGATGFVGRALIEELRSRGIHVDAVNAPRLTFDPAGSREAADQAISGSAGLEQFARTLQDVDVVVNAAGIADAGARSGASLFGANALLPLWLARAADLAGVDRMIHISSAAVQGRAPVLDESPVWAPFSPYSASKARGEEFLLGSDFATTEVVIVRATSVQGAERPTTIRLRKLARSWVASVARPGDRPTVVSSIDGLTAFVASVGGHPTSTPAIVLQPWEGLTTTDVLVAAGRRRPRMIPALVCRMVIGAGYLAAAVVPGLAGAVRRVELMWLGQAQDAAWARAAGLVVAPGVRDVLGGARESAS